MAPRVSVLIPVHDPGPFLSPALLSVRNQTLRDFEAICVDDGCTDGSTEVLQAVSLRPASRSTIPKSLCAEAFSGSSCTAAAR